MKTNRLLAITTLVIFCLNFAKADDGKYLRYQSILQLGDDSIRCSEMIKYAALVADSLNDFNFSALIFEKANSILKKKSYPILQLDLNYKWAHLYYIKGNFEEADRLLKKTMGLKHLQNDLPRKADVLNLAGANLQQLGGYKGALAYFTEVLEIYTKLKDIKGMGMVYVNMANIFVMSGNYAQSDSLFDKAGRIFLENNLPERYGTMLGNKAYIKWKLGSLDSGKVLLVRSLNLDFKKIRDFDVYISRQFNLALVYADLKEWDSCFYYLDAGKKLSDSLNMSDRNAGTYYFDAGYCYVQKGDLKKGIGYYKKGLQNKAGVNNYRILYENIAETYFKLKQYDSAFIYKNASLKMADSIYQSELREQANFENKKIELLEKDYQNQIREAEQQQFLNDLKRRNYLLISIVVVLISTVLLLVLYFRQYKLKEKKEHLESELDFLKAQLNPHFLFNSLNNIYVLLDENKEKASEILLKFSDLMRYQLYDCNVPSILLEKEIRFLENYIEFEKLRYSNTIRVEYATSGLSEGSFYIAPILLQPFIENAFKHSPKNKNNPSLIAINIVLNGCEFLLEVSNAFNAQEPSALPGGIGLENVKRRLKLLYPNKHDLKIVTTKHTFTISLKLSLSND